MTNTQEHEYALLGGINRAKIGRYLSVASALISALLVFLLLTAVDIANRLGMPTNLPPTALSLLGAGTIFSVLYWVFDRYAWRWQPIAKLLKVPNLVASWRCDGKSLDADGSVKFQWEGEIKIIQSWDKLRVRLKTKESGSNSIAAALTFDAADGYKLLYHYRNDPHMDHPELASHQGCAIITFTPDLKVGVGEYFNGGGRFTFGTMHLTRKK